jgi:hypothetical protein
MNSSLVWADFNGDKARDYAALIQANGRIVLVLFASDGSTYKQYALRSDQGFGGETGSLLTVVRRGSTYYDHGRKKTGVVRFDTIALAYCEKSAIAFVYEDGKFIEVWISD